MEYCKYSIWRVRFAIWVKARGMKYYQVSYDGSRERYPSLREDLTVLLCQNCGVMRIMQPVESTFVFATKDDVSLKTITDQITSAYEDAFGFVLSRIAVTTSGQLLLCAQQKDDETPDEGFEDLVERLKTEGKISKWVSVCTFV